MSFDFFCEVALWGPVSVYSSLYSQISGVHFWMMKWLFKMSSSCCCLFPGLKKKIYKSSRDPYIYTDILLHVNFRKLGNAKERSNYRTIALISHASKITLNILQARFQQYANPELPDVQAGFRKGRGTRDQSPNICWIIEKAREFEKSIYFSFVDYAKAFDCVDHNELWKILQEMGILEYLTFLLRNLFAGQEATIRTRHGTTDWFQVGKGVHPGYILSPCLFNLYAEWKVKVKVVQSCLTLCDPMDCPWNSLGQNTGWVAFPFSRGSSWHRNRTAVSCIARGFFTNWASGKSYMQSTSCKMLHKLDEAQAGMKIARRNINNHKYADDTTLMAESKRELRSFLMKVEEESEKVGLKLNIQKTKIMASGPIISWQINEEKLETVTDYFGGAPKHCRWWLQPWIERCLKLKKEKLWPT